MKTEIWVSFNYGGYGLVFSNTIELPFAPFFGLGVAFDSESEHEVKLDNDDYCTTTIDWNIQKQQFDVNVRNYWKFSVSHDTLDQTLKMFKEWERHDQTNMTLLKQVMEINK